MAGKHWSVWDELDPPGRLDEGRDELFLAICGSSPRQHECLLYRLPKSAPKSHGKPIEVAPERPKVRVYLAGSYIRKPRTFNRPASARSGETVVLWPRRGEGKEIREQGAWYDRRNRVWLIERGKMTERLRAISGPAAEAEAMRIANRFAARPGAAKRHQRYIDDEVGPDARRKSRVEEVNGIPSRVGSLGADPRERALAWNKIESNLPHQNARIQYRVILPLPEIFTPAERRRAVLEIGAAAFDRYGIPWSAAVHSPDKRSLGIERNFHVHFDHGNASEQAIREAQIWDSRAKKFRKYRLYLDVEWFPNLRSIATTIFNRILAERQRGPRDFELPEFTAEKQAFDAGDRPVQRHRGQAASKREAVGLLTLGQRRRIIDDPDPIAWIDHGLMLEAVDRIISLLPHLVSRPRPDDDVAKTLEILRRWGLDLAESILEELHQLDEVATYILLPIRTEKSELMESFEKLRSQVLTSVISTNAMEFPDQIRNLTDGNIFSRTLKGHLATEHERIVSDIENFEGAKLEVVDRRRMQLRGMYRLMALATREKTDALERLWRTFAGFRDAPIGMKYEYDKSPKSLGRAAVVELAKSGLGATIPDATGRFFVQDGRQARAYRPIGGSITLLESASSAHSPNPWHNGDRNQIYNDVQKIWKSGVNRILDRYDVRQRTSQRANAREDAPLRSAQTATEQQHRILDSAAHGATDAKSNSSSQGSVGGGSAALSASNHLSSAKEVVLRLRQAKQRPEQGH